MRKLGFAGVAALLVFSSMSWAQGDKAKPVADDQEVVVVEPTEEQESSVEDKFDEPTTVRVLGSVRSGGKVSAKVSGTGKLVRSATFSRRAGGHYAIGAFQKEYDVRLSKGTTTIVVTSSVPEDKTLTQTMTYTFVVE